MKTTKQSRTDMRTNYQILSSGEANRIIILLDDLDTLESRLEEATRLLERAKSLFLHELNINVDKWLSDLEAFNKGGQDVP